MGLRGPQPLAKSLKLLRGTARRDQGAQGQVVAPDAPDREELEPPKALSAAAKREWRRLLPRLVKAGIWAPEKRTEFETYCDLTARQDAYMKLCAGVKPQEAIKLGYVNALNKVQ